MNKENAIAWSDDFSIGIKEIDKQHKILVKLLNQLHEAICQREGREACKTVLDKLIDYIQVHFSTEESIMGMMHYPDLQKHKENHQELLNEILIMKKRYEKAQSNISLELLHFLKCWLQNHIMKTDKQAGAYILKQKEPENRNRLIKILKKTTKK